MPIRGFPAQNVVACFIEPNSIGAIDDYDASRNAPAKSPASNLDKVIWHSSFYQYEIAAGPTDVTINHTSLATTTNYHSVSTGGYGFGGSAPSGSTIGFAVVGQQRTTDIVLLAHGQGVVPKFMVSQGGRRVPDGFIVQQGSAGAHRRVSVWADATNIYLRESAISTSANLDAVSLTYKVMVFRNRAPDPAKPLFAGSIGGVLQIARGIIDSTRKYLRRTGAGDSPFALNLGPTLDINNGGARSASGGVVVTDPRYGGSMAAPSYVSVGVD